MRSSAHEAAIAALREVRSIAEPFAPSSPAMRKIIEAADGVLSEPPSTLMDDAAEYTDPTVDGVAPARSTDPGSSAAAAVAVAPRTGNQRGRCLMAMYRNTTAALGATAWDVETWTGLPTSSVSKRMGELERSGHVEHRDGRMRSTGRGGLGLVYYFTEKGLAWCREHAST